LAINQNADLAVQFMGEFSELSRELLGNDFARRDPPVVKLLEPLDLVVLQALDVSFYIGDSAIPPLAQVNRHHSTSSAVNPSVAGRFCFWFRRKRVSRPRAGRSGQKKDRRSAESCGYAELSGKSNGEPGRQPSTFDSGRLPNRQLLVTIWASQTVDK